MNEKLLTPEQVAERRRWQSGPSMDGCVEASCQRWNWGDCGASAPKTWKAS